MTFFMFLVAVMLLCVVLHFAVSRAVHTAAAVVAATLFVFLAMPALAANSIMETLAPPLLNVLSVVVTAAISVAAARFTQLTGVQIEARHREALHSALMTAARVAVERNFSGANAVSFVEDYARRSVPDAIRALAPSPTTLEALARSKIRQVLGN